ncbi:metal ABC transporter ATP-binding protein [Serpentinicella sp. ANB-PHB4]|uniref:metal ABC transporter ATP-binding protein n=1 Tax=Serpentinicella sp. ANB-PHB4 TaxID=3074076 RepID=UPI002856C4AF|nr:metal ABC transporter ATP-binding protein [Serpentinicella sp. ANB-PHB4]MDR5659595.1 metal ABC transporter ATP-binding protein [Serpentinicella sp. ANB-PHB4]
MGIVNALDIKNLSVSYNSKTALENIDVAVEPEQLVGIIGPNGAGKSTLIKAVLGLLKPEQGQISFFGQPLKKSHKKIAYVPQQSDIDLDFPITVEEVVLMGRYPHIKWWRRADKKDYEIVTRFLKEVGTEELRNKQIGELSGGQRQRVFLARALTQEADIFFLDEPFSGIDMASEEIIIKLLKKLRDQGKTIFVVHHDLSKVEEYFDSLLLLNKQLISYGKSTEVFNVKALQEAYQGNLTVIPGHSQLVVTC